MEINHQYYMLQPKKKTYGEHLVAFLALPFNIPSWLISLFIARHITHIALNPRATTTQRMIHLAKVSEHSCDDIIVVNFKKRVSSQWWSNFFLKFAYAFSFLPFIEPQIKRNISLADAANKEHIDTILIEIDKLIHGSSEQKNCIGRRFDWAHIHLKGMEFLTAKARAYVYERLNAQYGDVAYTTPNTTPIKFFTLQSSNEAELDSVELSSSKEELKPMSERRFVITCLARDQNYINWLRDLKYTTQHLEATAISFNYREVDLSRGIIWTQQDMVQDICAHVERLMQLGAKPEHICIDGMCLAGAIATLATAQLHRANIKVKLNNERSFRSIPHLILGFIAPEIQTANWKNPVTYLRFIAAGLIYAISTPLLWLSGWYANAEHAWNEIPINDKIFSVIRDNKEKRYDGIIHDQLSSIASLIDLHLNKIKQKIQKKDSLTTEELAFLAEYNQAEEPYFTPLAKPNSSIAHFMARKDLIAVCAHGTPYTNHNYFLNKLKEKFNSADNIVKQKTTTRDITQTPALPPPQKPLIIACSGGSGHISAAKGIIHELKKHDPQINISQHEAKLYKKEHITLSGIFILFGVWITSLPVLGTLIKKIASWLSVPSMPDYEIFWDQMNKLRQAESTTINGKECGVSRPYIDVLLDFYPAGYEYVAYNNAAHLSLTAKDTTSMSTYKGSIEYFHHSSVVSNVIQQLQKAAQNKEPYTEVISTQALSLKSICEAVLYYNNIFLPQYNATHQTTYPPIAIDQYMTDLPSLGCTHFMDNLENLSQEYRQLIKLNAVHINAPLKNAYFGVNNGFQKVIDIKPATNPMVRAHFKKPELIAFTNTDIPQHLFYKMYTKDMATHILKPLDNKERIIKAKEKVASIMIGSLAANASADYVEYLLTDGYDSIFIFGGSNEEIEKRIHKIIIKYPQEQQAKIAQKIICLSSQTDEEMAPIFARSNCVIIRGGGLSVMEQMAIPLINNKIVLIHHENSPNNILTSGLSWEDNNADGLIDYLQDKKIFAVKTSPNLCNDALEQAKHYYSQPISCPTTSIPGEKPLSNEWIKHPAQSSVTTLSAFFSPTISMNNSQKYIQYLATQSNSL